MSKKRGRKSSDGEPDGDNSDIVVLSQKGIREDEFFRPNGVKDEVCVVVKAHVFRIELGPANGGQLPKNIVWTPELAYDGEVKKKKKKKKRTEILT